MATIEKRIVNDKTMYSVDGAWLTEKEFEVYKEIIENQGGEYFGKDDDVKINDNIRYNFENPYGL